MITVRPIHETDAAQAAALFNEFIAEGKYTILVDLFTIERQLELQRLASNKGVYMVAVDDVTLVGMQLVLPLSELSSLRHVGDIGTYVSPNAHTKGIGRALTEATLKAARERGYSKVMAMIRADNPRAIAFYESIGFRYVGTASGHALVMGQYVDECLMERFL
jgi:L-amino acid N-acyltransferase YncA